MYNPDPGAPRSGPTTTERLLGAPPVAAVAAAVSAGRLRGLAYHRVPDGAAFRAQLEELARNWTVVDLDAVVDWFAGRRDLPRRPVWITFDDGDPTVLDAGIEELDRAGLPATLFVCPGLVEAARPPWWRSVEHALGQAGEVEVEGRRWTDRSVVTHLKTVPDETRRAVVDGLERRYGTPDDPVLRVDDLHRWRRSGHTLGNHTWDHPCLDRCSPDELRRQVIDARDWLRSHDLAPREVFAYPNGNRSDAAEAVLTEAGVELCALFDHRLAGRGSGHLRCSRLRIDSDASETRFRAVLSGGHSGFFHARHDLRVAASRIRRS